MAVPRVFVIVLDHLFDLLRWGIVMEGIEHVYHPFQWFDAYEVAAFNQGVDEGVIDSSAVCLLKR